MRRGELPRPAGTRAAGSAEIIRAWIVNNQLVCTIRAGAWSARRNWAMLIADLLRNIGRTFASDGVGKEQAIEELFELVKQEMKKKEDDRTNVVEAEGEPVEPIVTPVEQSIETEEDDEEEVELGS